jgi:hypothetical protein
VRRPSRVIKANAIVRFSTHQEAEVALEAVRERKWSGVASGAALLYNSTPYDGVGGRGWCVVEQGASLVVAAHLAKAKESGELLERFARAEASRPKVIDITGGKTAARELTEDPVALLDCTMKTLAEARFTFPSDCTMANQMMGDFEWTIKTAMEQAIAYPAASGRTLQPADMREARRRMRKMEQTQREATREGALQETGT